MDIKNLNQSKRNFSAVQGLQELYLSFFPFQPDTSRNINCSICVILDQLNWSSLEKCKNFGHLTIKWVLILVCGAKPFVFFTI